MNTTENFIRDTVSLILESALEAKAEREKATASGDKEKELFEGGRAAGYYEVISTIVGQFKSFDIDETKFGIPVEFVPDRDLL